MPRPLIGITCGAQKRAGGEPVYGTLPAYVDAVLAAGGLPVLIAPTLGEHEDVLREIYERLDGVLLAGGGDVDPAQYGMTGDDTLESVQPDRDKTEIAVARWAVSDDKPLFGICRGIQVANVALGGTLYRDIAKEYPGYDGIDHDQWGKQPRGYEAHRVEIDPGTRLAEALGAHSIKVNTMHHQALRDVAPNLKISARAADGLIEGVELPDARFCVGVQWHPEEMADNSEPMRRLFAAFIDAARG